MYDVVIVGAGPVGLACGISAKRQGLAPLIVDKGALVNSFLGYPVNMEFFSTPELMEIGGHPFPTAGYKPIREEGIEYYRRVAQAEALPLRLYERVLRVDGAKGSFDVVTAADSYRARFVIIAIGFFDIPNLMRVPGEELPKASHYFREPFAYTGQKVVVVGSKNSAAKAALSCYRHGADVTLVVRGPQLADQVKYWIRPDLENRIKEGSIRAFFDTCVERITDHSVVVRTPGGLEEIENDWVLAMTGYQPDFGFLRGIGLEVGTDPDETPVYDEATFESSRPGIYLAGTVCGGRRTSRWFIENGRFHAEQIARHMAHGHVARVELEKGEWKTAE